jgi:tripartite-type tricarboxylate transporter receptor subunit TctC
VIPDVPTIGELGYKIDLTRVYFGIVAPAGTPKPILDRLRNEMAQVINDPDFREKHLTSRGHEPVANTPDEFAKFLTLDRLLSRRIVQDAGVQPQ